MSEAVQPPETGIIESYRKHYAATFARHGPTSRGVDWGEWPDVHVRYEKMLEVIRARRSEAAVPTLLDVGCGFGGLLDYANEHSVALDYDTFVNVPKLDAKDLGKVQRVYKAEDFDFRLKPGSAAIDRGTILNNVTDAFSGAAPDLGALELGQDPPHYGPRR